MANLIIKSSADNLVLQGSDASPAITVGATGTTTFAENATLSGTANNLGTVTAGSIAGGSITSATAFPAGHVLQVLSTTKTDTWISSAGSTWADITGMSVTITPTATSNKILVFGVTYTGDTASGDVMTKIVRGSTDICIGDSSVSSTRATTGGSLREVYETLAHPYNFLDSPSTTSATTYKIQLWHGGTNGGCVNQSSNDAGNVNAERLASTITVMEIKG